ncbi:hypothetical protein KFE25_003949 [Diacronema lutheri]|uniref:non-specific serine/threonine protein kinase n=1 Tax=Diacronema lutheri TaxID=2081491 RepID=A0A8J5X8M9_DIALT|nr:hypothetical protein KFE25_003949 [Diacronema lutheri]
MSPPGYRPVRVLGAGASARVTLVQAEADGLYYASKAVDLSLMADDERAALEREVATHRSLTPHAHIIGLKESVLEGETMHIVLEYADGGDLAAVLHRQRIRGTPLPEDETLRIVAALALALKHCHEARVLHRDVKAGNVFLSADRRKVKLGDFGIAKALTAGSELATSQVGTPYYMAPEVANAQPYDVRCDVWALGVIAYELAALTRPFEASGYAELMLKVARGSYAPLPKHVSRPLAELVRALLATRPEQRPTAAEVCARPVLQPHVRALLDATDADVAASGRLPTTPSSRTLVSGAYAASAATLLGAGGGSGGVGMVAGAAGLLTPPPARPAAASAGATPRSAPPARTRPEFSAVGGQPLAIEGAGLALPSSARAARRAPRGGRAAERVGFAVEAEYVCFGNDRDETHSNTAHGDSVGADGVNGAHGAAARQLARLQALLSGSPAGEGGGSEAELLFAQAVQIEQRLRSAEGDADGAPLAITPARSAAAGARAGPPQLNVAPPSASPLCAGADADADGATPMEFDEPARDAATVAHAHGEANDTAADADVAAAARDKRQRAERANAVATRRRTREAAARLANERVSEAHRRNAIAQRRRTAFALYSVVGGGGAKGAANGGAGDGGGGGGGGGGAGDRAGARRSPSGATLAPATHAAGRAADASARPHTASAAGARARQSRAPAAPVAEAGAAATRQPQLSGVPVPAAPAHRALGKPSGKRNALSLPAGAHRPSLPAAQTGAQSAAPAPAAAVPADTHWRATRQRTDGGGPLRAGSPRTPEAQGERAGAGAGAAPVGASNAPRQTSLDGATHAAALVAAPNARSGGAAACEGGSGSAAAARAAARTGPEADARAFSVRTLEMVAVLRLPLGTDAQIAGAARAVTRAQGFLAWLRAAAARVESLEGTLFQALCTLPSPAGGASARAGEDATLEALLASTPGRRAAASGSTQHASASGHSPLSRSQQGREFIDSATAAHGLLLRACAQPSPGGAAGAPAATAEATAVQAAVEAAALRALLRIKLEDDNDLNLARAALDSCARALEQANAIAAGGHIGAHAAVRAAEPCAGTARVLELARTDEAALLAALLASREPRAVGGAPDSGAPNDAPSSLRAHGSAAHADAEPDLVKHAAIHVTPPRAARARVASPRTPPTPVDAMDMGEQQRRQQQLPPLQQQFGSHGVEGRATPGTDDATAPPAASSLLRAWRVQRSERRAAGVPIFSPLAARAADDEGAEVDGDGGGEQRARPAELAAPMASPRAAGQRGVASASHSAGAARGEVGGAGGGEIARHLVSLKAHSAYVAASNAACASASRAATPPPLEHAAPAAPAAPAVPMERPTGGADRARAADVDEHARRASAPPAPLSALPACEKHAPHATAGGGAPAHAAAQRGRQSLGGASGGGLTPSVLTMLSGLGLSAASARQRPSAADAFELDLDLGESDDEARDAPEGASRSSRGADDALPSGAQHAAAPRAGKPKLSSRLMQKFRGVFGAKMHGEGKPSTGADALVAAAGGARLPLRPMRGPPARASTGAEPYVPVGMAS